MYEQIFDRINASTLILTVNRRLASQLKRLYSQWRGQKSSCWPTPQILPLQVWQIEYLQGLQVLGKFPDKLMLTDVQTQLVWEQIIQASKHSHELLQINKTAQLAQSAWNMLQQWQIDLSEIRHDPKEDVQAFYHWAAQFQNKCQTNNWLAPATLTHEIINILPEQSAKLPTQFYFIGFDEINPQLQKLISSLQNLNVRCIQFQPDEQKTKVVRTCAATTQQEIHHMAAWAKQCLAQKSNKPIACIVPNLTTLHTQIERVFRQTLHPQTQTNLNPITSQELVFNISGGKPLSQFPLINMAFKLLTLAQKQLAIDEISSVIRSPFIAFAEQEFFSRHCLESKIYDLSLTQLNLSELCFHLEKLNKKNKKINLPFPRLLQQFKALHAQMSENKSRQYPSQWAQFFCQLLQIIGWPGERSLDSHEHQLMQRWQTLLSEFAQLDCVNPCMSYTAALNLLQQLANNTIYQAKSNDAPIQVMGVLEAAGIAFQAVWIMGLHDGQWPPAPNPNPFLPIKLQQQLQMPHASTQREQIFTQAVTQRLIHSAENVILSYPTHDERDEILRCSPFISNYPLHSIEQLVTITEPSIQKKLFESSQLENINNDNAPPLQQNENLYGGTWLIKDQATCPFRAFARYRLGAYSYYQAQHGISPQQRGSIIHAALASFWQKVQTQQQLITLNTNELSICLDECIDGALQETLGKNWLRNNNKLAQLEHSYHKNLLHDWLEIEKQRPSFKVIAQEQQQQLKLGSITLNIQIDRIDEINDKQQLIIDYKTGNTSPRDWFGPRPEEPQLPLYCIANKTAVTGLLFAQLKLGKLTYKGITQDEDVIPKIPSIAAQDLNESITSWPIQLQMWHENLTQLASDFTDGHAVVDPKIPGASCQYCDLHGLCRINESE